MKGGDCRSMILARVCPGRRVLRSKIHRHCCSEGRARSEIAIGSVRADFAVCGGTESDEKALGSGGGGGGVLRNGDGADDDL